MTSENFYLQGGGSFSVDFGFDLNIFNFNHFEIMSNLAHDTDEPDYPLPPRPDVSHIETENDDPVDNIASAKQQRLLVESLYSSWSPGRKFMIDTNVGVFNSISEPPVVPDVFLSMDVEPAVDWWKKEHRSYFAWEFGKYPELVIEVISNRKGGELADKMAKYAKLGIVYYVIYDPNHHVLKNETLRAHIRHGTTYTEMASPYFQELQLRLGVWEGDYESRHDRWLRWMRIDDSLILTGKERADQEAQRADQEAQRAERLAVKLRELGIDPTAV